MPHPFELRKEITLEATPGQLWEAIATGRGSTPGSWAATWLVEGRGDGTTVLRLVQSGVLGDDWETEGDRVRLTPDGLAPIEGVVDYVSPAFLGVRSDDGLYRFVRGFDGSVAMGHHLFAHDLDPDEAERASQAWLGRVFPASE